MLMQPFVKFLLCFSFLIFAKFHLKRTTIFTNFPTIHGWMKCWNEWRSGGKENVYFYFFAESSHASILPWLSIKTGGSKRVQRAFPRWRIKTNDRSKHQIGKTFSQAAFYANYVFTPKGEKVMETRSIQLKSKWETDRKIFILSFN